MYGLAYYSTLWHIIRPFWHDSLWNYFNVTFLHILLSLSLYSFFRATFSDPGMVPLSKSKIDFSAFTSSRGHEKDYPTMITSQSSGDESQSHEENWAMCRSCETYRPPRAQHCRKCKRCIRKHDHHCVWINNCVGEISRKFFVLFCMYTAVLCFHGFVQAIITLYINRHQIVAINLIFIIIAILIFIIFGIFSAAMLGDQLLVAVWDNFNSAKWIYINGKRVKKIQKPLKLILQEIFGKDWIILWFVPCKSPKVTLSDSHFI